MTPLTSDEARQQIARRIQAIEKKSAAEVVVTLQARSGDYLRADLTFGALAALAILCLFLYHPEPFDFTFFPVEQVVTFVLAAVLCAHVPPLRRTLTPRRLRRENVDRAACTAFVLRGIDRTRARSGILVYLGRFEQEATIVADRGLDAPSVAPAIAVAETSLRAALKKGSLEGVLAALDGLGEALAVAYPAGDDDIDELSNEVAA